MQNFSYIKIIMLMEDGKWSSGRKMENNIEVIVYFWIMMNQEIVSKTDRTKSKGFIVSIIILKIINTTKSNNLTNNCRRAIERKVKLVCVDELN